MIDQTRAQHLAYQSGDLAYLIEQIRVALQRNHPADSITRRYAQLTRRANARHTRRLAAWARVVNSSDEEFDRLDKTGFLDEAERLLTAWGREHG